MNSNVTSLVEGQKSRQKLGSLHVIPVGFALLLGLGSISACVDVNGGAAELSWSIRTFEGTAVDDCATVGIEEIQLCWESLGDGGAAGDGRCLPSRSRAFSCAEESGATRFELPPGPTSLWIQPVCADGMPPADGTFQVPPPIVRTVEDGAVVTLNSLLVAVADPASCAGVGCTCQR